MNVRNCQEADDQGMVAHTGRMLARFHIGLCLASQGNGGTDRLITLSHGGHSCHATVNLRHAP